MRYPRLLTEEGKTEFHEYLKDLQEIPKKYPPDLNQEPYSKDVSEDIAVRIDENRYFSTKMEMAEYLCERFKDANLEMAELINLDGLWSWLAYVWFDQLAPLENGSRKLSKTKRYICGKSYTAYSGHFIAFPFYVYSLHGKEKSKIFLQHPLDYIGRVTEHIGSRRYVMSSENLLDVLHTLYWNKSKQSIKQGAPSDKVPGNFRRFGKVVNQLKLTYDLHGMNPEKIIDILPSEFDRWLNNG